MTGVLKQDIIESLRPLPYAREVQAWLIDFLSAATSKKKPPSDYIRDLSRPSGIFVDASDINKAVETIKNIYARTGYIPPWEMEDELILAYKPELPAAAMKVARQFSASERVRDPLTNYYQKPQVPLVMGLSALYTQSTELPVSVVEIDFSNMRGTNEHNEQILRTAYPDMDERDVREKAMALTDEYAFLVAGSIMKSVEDRINKNRLPSVTLMPIRTGGDEVRLVAVNMSQAEALKILPAIHDDIEATTAALGLHDHPHAKRPTDNFSNGFGAAGTVFPLACDGQFDDALARADKAISLNKIELGRARAESTTFAALKPENFDLKTLYKDQKAALAYLQKLEEVITAQKIALNTHTMPIEDLPSIEKIVHQANLDHIPDKAETQTLIFESFRERLSSRGVQLSADHEKILRIKVLKFPQDDPSSGALIGRDFPAMAGVAAQVSRDINEKTGNNTPLWTLGISFHNLAGLNETLGHGHSNLVLRYQAQDIVRESLHKIGLSQKNFQLAHMGNGDFHAVIQPTIIDDPDTVHTITADDMQKLSQEIDRRMEVLNNTPVASFLQRYQVQGPANLPETFAELENPRDERCPGLRASVSIRPYIIDTQLNTHNERRGGAIMRFITEHLAETASVNKQRWAQTVTHNSAPEPELPFARPL